MAFSICIQLCLLLCGRLQGREREGDSEGETPRVGYEAQPKPLSESHMEMPSVTV